MKNVIDEERAVSDIDSRLATMRARKVAAEAEQELLALEAAEFERLASKFKDVKLAIREMLGRADFSRETHGDRYALAYEKLCVAKQELLDFHMQSATHEREKIGEIAGTNTGDTASVRMKLFLLDFKFYNPDTIYDRISNEKALKKLKRDDRAAQDLERKTKREIFAVVALSALIPVVLIALAIF